MIPEWLEDGKLGEMSEEVERFLIELNSICEKHGMTLSVDGYDSFQVWKGKQKNEESYLHANGFEDCTRRT